uniref:Uncharacterized protein n=1 Tax=Anopheles stephensi TaxID=30069 RepID=A0A182YK90_ANOST
MQSIRIATFVPVLLLLLLAVLADGLPYPRPMPQNLRRLPRRNDFVAYNLHRIIRPRDVNDLGVDQARKAMHDVHETIAEVQRLLSLDPSLPRLTRGEIEELFENVTREEFTKSLRAGDHHRAQHMRALMLVLPYHANNLSPESMQKIYTRPPVTRIVGAASNARPTETLPITPGRFVASSTTTTAMTTTAAPATSGPRTTTAPIPVTTIRFTTPRPTTFHPTLPERMRDASHRKENMNEILAAIGLSQSSEELSTPPTFRPLPADMTTIAPSTTSSAASVTEDTINNAINVDDPKVAQELKDLLRSFGLLKEADSEASANSPLPHAERLVDIQPAALVLHEPLKVEESTPTIEPKKLAVESTGGLTQASVKADDYVAFKPLPIGTLIDDAADAKPIDEELDALLKSFGLLGPGPRNKKSMHPEPTQKPPSTQMVMKSVPSIDADLVAPQLMSVLGTLGIQMKNGQQQAPSTRVTPLVRRREKTPRKLDPPIDQTPSAAHLRVSNEDYRKLEQLWQTVKQLEQLNASLTDDSLDVLNPKHYNLSPSLLAQGPDPLLDSVDAREKLNEIKKRQEPATSTTTTSPTASSVVNDDSAPVTESDTPFRFSLQLNTGGSSTTSEDSELEDSLSKITTTETSSDTTTSPTTTSTTTTTTESARNAALEDSFPSSDLAGDPVNEEPLPPPRRNGFYFLYDWNTFLEVGEEPNKVIIRYNPQAGDPSRFLPVTVP